jgi:UPF0755 protein
MQTFIREHIIGFWVILAVFAALGLFLYGLTPASGNANAAPVVFEVKQGSRFRDIISDLRSAGLIRSSSAAEAFSLLAGSARGMQPGFYKLSPAMSAPSILRAIASGAVQEITVVVPEGSNLYQIDAILADALVIRRGELIDLAKASGTAVGLEGKLFPDTYRFFAGSKIQDVVQKFLDNFDAKAAPLLAADKKNAAGDLIIASMVDKEVPDPSDQKIVAGIMIKRLAAGMPLDVDATICYAKLQEDPFAAAGCYPLASVDFKIRSPYNTYLNKGLPPGPIGNPGISALSAAIHPQSSPYWFYLSDPATGKTIFAKTLDEQNTNAVKYLKGY